MSNFIDEIIAGHVIEHHDHEYEFKSVSVVQHWEGSHNIFLTQEDEGSGGKKFDAVIVLSRQQTEKLIAVLSKTVQRESGSSGSVRDATRQP